MSTVTFSSIVPYGLYMAVVGLLVEIRLFLPFIPLLLLMNLLARPKAREPAAAAQDFANDFESSPTIQRR